MPEQHILLLNAQLQQARDVYQAGQIGKVVEDECDIYARDGFINNLIEVLSEKRIRKAEEDQITLDEETLDKIRQFQEVHWPILQNQHEGRITRDWNPFPDQVRNTVQGREIDRMIDKLAKILGQEEYLISYGIRKIREETDLGWHCGNMTAERARRNPNDTFVKNQRTT